MIISMMIFSWLTTQEKTRPRPRHSIFWDGLSGLSLHTACFRRLQVSPPSLPQASGLEKLTSFQAKRPCLPVMYNWGNLIFLFRTCDSGRSCWGTVVLLWFHVRFFLWFVLLYKMGRMFCLVACFDGGAHMLCNACDLRRCKAGMQLI